MTTTKSKQLQAELSTLFEETADGVWASGPEGRILLWNRAAEAILGYPARQVLGRLCRDVLAGCDGNGNRLCGWPCPIKMQLREGELVQHFDMLTRKKTGQPVWLDVSCLSLPRNDGEVPTVVHLFRDVTAAHQIEVLVRQQLAERKLAVTEESPVLNGMLTQRELQIVSLMREAATTSAIAQKLFISRATVRNHVQNIFAKLGVHSRLEAVAYVNRLTQSQTGT